MEHVAGKMLLFMGILYPLLATSQDNKLANNKQFTNSLIHESSPYLIEHAHNPVNWYPWGEKALQKARNENKPLLISIGYAACHWCHVMERETFSDTIIANFMNKHFVSIKVDREERPDVDKVYLNAVQLITGEGGWPLNAFALPDGRTFHGGTYFPPNQWLTLLNQIVTLYEKEPQKIIKQAENVADGIKAEEVYNVKQAGKLFSKEDYQKVFSALKPSIDYEWGGYKGIPKFPLPVQWEAVLQFYYITNDAAALNAVTTTLDNIASGGIYDQIGGGFSRYSTDERWRVPHFEKMLYDNAQLVSLYAHAYQVTGKKLYADIITKTLAFLEKNLATPEGAFYSSLNADSQGEEGKFYVWDFAEVNKILIEKTAPLIIDYYHITPTGNWAQGKNILYRELTDEAFIEKHNLTNEGLIKTLEDANQKLLDARNTRIPPSIDDKILTSWNALMVKGYIDAYRALGNVHYLESAIKTASFIEQKMMQDNAGLWRCYKNNKTTIPAFLDDFSFTIDAFTNLYQVTFDIHWLNLSKELTAYVLNHFYDDKSNMFFFTSDLSDNTMLRKVESIDAVMPSSNSVMANNLFLLGAYFDSSRFVTISSAMLTSVMSTLSQSNPLGGNWARLLGLTTFKIYEVAIMGDNALVKNKEIQKHYLPTSLFMGGCLENLPLLENKLIKGKTVIYTCRDKVCKMPVSESSQALKMIVIDQ